MILFERDYALLGGLLVQSAVFKFNFLQCVRWIR